MKTHKKCIYCGEYIILNSEDLELLYDGWITLQSIELCEECSENQNNEPDYFAGYDSEF